jgi:hypothetical protein
MADKRYLLRMRLPERRLHVLIAASAEIRDDHILFLNTKGELLSLFMFEAVENWTEAELA